MFRVKIGLGLFVAALLTWSAACQQTPPDAPNDPDNSVPSPTPRPTARPSPEPNQPTPPPDAPDPDPDQPKPDDPGDDDPGQAPDPGDDPDNPSDPGDDSPAPTPDPRLGVWRHTAGELFRFIGGTPDTRLEYLVLSDDGIADFIVRDPRTNILSCEQAVFVLPTPEAMILEIFEAALLRTRQSDPNNFVLADASNLTASFVREGAVPEELQCRDFRILRQIEDVEVSPRFAHGAAHDGTSIRFNSSNELVEEFDPVLGLFYEPVEVTGILGKRIHAAQDDTFWYTCGCNLQQLAVRRTPAGVVVDAVPIEVLAEFEGSKTVQAMAYDEAGGALWLSVEIQSPNGRFHLILAKVDVSAEPKVLLDAFPFEAEIDAMVFDGVHLWVLSQFDSTVAQVDVEARQAIATYRLPDPRLDWEAITFADGRLFLLGGDDFEEEGVIVELLPEGQAAPPAPSAPQPFDPFGVWELAEGSILADEGGRAPKIIEIRDDGSAQLVYLNEDTGHIRCFEGQSALDESQVLTLSFDEVLGIEDVVAVAQVAFYEPHVLQLTQPDGSVSTLLRRRRLPERYTCRALQEVERIGLAVAPNTRSGLGYDGTALWYSASPFEAIAIDPATGELVATTGFAAERFVQAMEGADFWTVSQERFAFAARLGPDGTQARQVAIADTHLRAAGFDPIAGALWVHGQKAGVFNLLQVDPAADPAKVLRLRTFKLFVEAMAVDGQRLWVLADGDHLLEVEPETAKTIATYLNPVPAFDWFGVAKVEESLYLIGTNPLTQQGILLEVKPQP